MRLLACLEIDTEACSRRKSSKQEGKATRHHLTLLKSLDRREEKECSPAVTRSQPWKWGAVTEKAFLEPQIECSGLWDLVLII